MLRVNEICFSYQDKLVVKNVDFSLTKGKNLALIGESGCGKSTLLKLIYGLYDLDEGQIFWNETEVLGPKFHLIPGMPFMKYLAQDFDLMPFITVGENVGKYLSNFFPEEKQQRIAELLEIVEMTEYAAVKAKFLSGGQMQRVALARVLALEPEVLLLDEPFLGLAPMVVEEIRHALNILRQDGMTMILVEQKLDIALPFTSRTHVMIKGQLALVQDSAQLMESPDLAQLYFRLSQPLS